MAINASRREEKEIIEETMRLEKERLEKAMKKESSSTRSLFLEFAFY